MPERDWAKDMEIALSIPANVRVVDTGKDLEVIGIDDRDDRQRQLVAMWFMWAKSRWPAALEERARLEKRTRKLEEENRRLRVVVEAARKIADPLPDDPHTWWLEIFDLKLQRLREALVALEEAKD
ncbi:MAG: hypothetical protein ACPL5F_01555 [Moorellaceae bacterium]